MYDVRICVAEKLERDFLRREIPPDEAIAFAESALADNEIGLAILEPAVREILERIVKA